MSAVHPRISKAPFIAATSLLFFMVLGNIISSQTLSPTYIQVIDENREGVAYYLTHIRPLSIFSSELARYTNQFGASLEKDVFEKEIKRNNEIIKQESLLQQNPQARDVLSNLASLYGEAGDRTKSEIYLKKARAVDPSIK